MRRKRAARINRDPAPVQQLVARLAAEQLAALGGGAPLAGDLQPPVLAQLVLVVAAQLGTGATPQAIADALLARVPAGASLTCNRVPVAAKTVNQVAHRLERDGLAMLVRGAGGVLVVPLVAP